MPSKHAGRSSRSSAGGAVVVGTAGLEHCSPWQAGRGAWGGGAYNNNGGFGAFEYSQLLPVRVPYTIGGNYMIRIDDPSQRQATLDAMGEITGPILAITMVLSSVLLPSAFLGGITGQFFRQFALTISVSMLISAVNAMTMTPARGSGPN